ncbi:MBL fold metallo-hydrolase [Candidatus Woesearchaeota archaeon]|nr:MBL fold metallo-hydrolase [Candidatus Woesearchaeota archaeon]
MLELNGLKIEWLGHASVRITGNKVIYIDPFQLQGAQPGADLILITHGHYDHCSIADINKILKQDTVIFATPDCTSKLAKLEKNNLKLVEPNKSYSLGNVKLETVCAYNPTKQFHPKLNDWVGYIVTANGTRIYHAGDTDLIPEMQQIKADVALLPVGGTYTMDAQEAAQAANTIKPKIAVPIHWGSIVGDKATAEKFKKLSKVEVRILG